MPSAQLNRPFLNLEQAAFFAQVSVRTARAMHAEGALPQARRLDGGTFEPTPGKPLIPYSELRERLTGQARYLLELWQERRVEVPPTEGSRARARPLSDVIYTDNGHGER